jgi:hypothetical protein
MKNRVAMFWLWDSSNTAFSKKQWSKRSFASQALLASKGISGSHQISGLTNHILALNQYNKCETAVLAGLMLGV